VEAALTTFSAFRQLNAFSTADLARPVNLPERGDITLVEPSAANDRNRRRLKPLRRIEGVDVEVDGDLLSRFRILHLKTVVAVRLAWN
jgi:hypothetical protein